MKKKKKKWAQRSRDSQGFKWRSKIEIAVAKKWFREPLKPHHDRNLQPCSVFTCFTHYVLSEPKTEEKNPIKLLSTNLEWDVSFSLKRFKEENSDDRSSFFFQFQGFVLKCLYSLYTCAFLFFLPQLFLLFSIELSTLPVIII